VQRSVIEPFQIKGADPGEDVVTSSASHGLRQLGHQNLSAGGRGTQPCRFDHRDAEDIVVSTATSPPEIPMRTS